MCRKAAIRVITLALQLHSRIAYEPDSTTTRLAETFPRFAPEVVWDEVLSAN